MPGQVICPGPLADTIRQLATSHDGVGGTRYSSVAQRGTKIKFTLRYHWHITRRGRAQ
eukprot:gene31328-6475_t